MIEILLFGLSSNRGGIETYLKKIWDNIDHDRFHFNFIDMVGEESKPCFYHELVESGCSFFKITPRRVSVKKNRNDFKTLFEQNHFDIFHFNVNTLSYLLPVELALKNNCRVIVHSRNAGASNNILTKILHNINKKRMKHMNVYKIAVSHDAGFWLFGDKNFEVYHNGVDTGKFKFSLEKRQKLREIENVGDKIVVGNVGAFLPAKNHRFIVDIFFEFLKQKNNAILWLVGDGDGRKEIEDLVRQKGIEDSVRFLGIQKDMPSIYSAMDVFLFPSFYEGFPNAVLEAECEGLPCLISDCIPQDVKLFDFVDSCSLSNNASLWAGKLISLLHKNDFDRQSKSVELEKMGASVRSEIARLEKLYLSLAETRDTYE